MKKEYKTERILVSAAFMAAVGIYSAVLSDVSVIQWSKGRRRLSKRQIAGLVLGSSIVVKLLFVGKLNQIDGLGGIYKKGTR